MRETICTVLGVVGGALAAAFGGWQAIEVIARLLFTLDGGGLQIETYPSGWCRHWFTPCPLRTAH